MCTRTFGERQIVVACKKIVSKGSGSKNEKRTQCPVVKLVPILGRCWHRHDEIRVRGRYEEGVVYSMLNMMVGMKMAI